VRFCEPPRKLYAIFGNIWEQSAVHRARKNRAGIPTHSGLSVRSQGNDGLCRIPAIRSTEGIGSVAPRHSATSAAACPAPVGDSLVFVILRERDGLPDGVGSAIASLPDEEGWPVKRRRWLPTSCMFQATIWTEIPQIGVGCRTKIVLTRALQTENLFAHDRRGDGECTLDVDLS
jgi:hypothetical protein